MAEGILGGFDPAQLQALLAQFSPSADDEKAARSRALMAAGLAMMGARKGQEWQAVGNAGLLGLNARDQYLQEQQQRRMAQMVSARGLMDLQQQMQAAQDQQRERGVMANFRMPPPTAGSQPSAAFTPEVNATKTMAPAAGLHEMLLAKADALEKAGLPQRAESYRLLAEKYAPQYEGTETVTDPTTGKPVLLQKFKNKAPEPMKYKPPPKFREMNTGGAISLINENNISPSGMSAPVTMNQNQIEQNRIAQGHLGLAANADRRAAANQGTLVQDASGNYVRVQGTQGEPVKVGNAPLQGAGQKPSDQQLAARGFLERMQGANEIVTKLEAKGYTPSFGAAYTETMGKAPLIGGTAGGLASMIGNAIQPNMQPYQQAQDDWIRAKLRKESGAVISEHEMEGERRTYFPKPGDSDAVIKQKAQARQRAEQQLMIQAGLDKGIPSKNIRAAADAILEGR